MRSLASRVRKVENLQIAVLESFESALLTCLEILSILSPQFCYGTGQEEDTPKIDTRITTQICEITIVLYAHLFC